MDDNIRKLYEDEIGKELLEGLEKLGETEPVVKKILEENHTRELSKRLAAAFLITVDNRNKALGQLIEMTNIKLPQ